MIFGQFDPSKGEIYQVINEQAEALPDRQVPEESQLIEWYRNMSILRAVDDKAFRLQRMGRMNTYPQVKGAEAIQIGASNAMHKDDWLAPSYREIGMMQQCGVPFEQTWLYWLGNEQGSKIPEDANVLPIAVPVGSQMLHGTGLAWAAKIKGNKHAVIACCGDGATSEGEVHEAFNFAGVLKVPVVFLVTNNQFAISVPRSSQTASATIAEKAKSYGFEGIMVDGMDVVAMHQVVSEALDKARNGGGPSLIEAVTFRLCDHTTADNAKIYQDQAELEKWKKRDGVERTRRFLTNKGWWDDAKEEALQMEAKAVVDHTVKSMEGTTKPNIEDIFKYNYANMPAHLTEQMAELKEFCNSDT